jgi:sugar phosphate isomerase/epimerase
MGNQLSLPERNGGRGADGARAEALADAEELIADLAALLDAGLIVVHEHVLGSARYGAAPEPEHQEARPSREHSRDPAMSGLFR